MFGWKIDKWPGLEAIPEGMEYWMEMMKGIMLILSNVEWRNTRLVKESIAEEISIMKQQPGKDMVIFGSGSIVSTFMQFGLIDDIGL